MAPPRKRARTDLPADRTLLSASAETRCNDRDSLSQAKRRRNMLDIRMHLKELQDENIGSLSSMLKRLADADDSVANEVRRVWHSHVSQQRLHGIDFDHYIRDVWYEINRDRCLKLLGEQDSADEDIEKVTLEAIEFIGGIINIIESRASEQRACYATKLSGMKTLRKIGKIMYTCHEYDEGNLVARRVHSYFDGDTTLGLAMQSIVRSMSDEEVTRMATEYDNGMRFSDRMEDLLALEKEYSLEMGLGAAMSLIEEKERRHTYAVVNALAYGFDRNSGNESEAENGLSVEGSDVEGSDVERPDVERSDTEDDPQRAGDDVGKKSNDSSSNDGEESLADTPNNDEDEDDLTDTPHIEDSEDDSTEYPLNLARRRPIVPDRTNLPRIDAAIELNELVREKQSDRAIEAVLEGIRQEYREHRGRKPNVQDTARTARKRRHSEAMSEASGRSSHEVQTRFPWLRKMFQSGSGNRKLKMLKRLGSGTTPDRRRALHVRN